MQMLNVVKFKISDFCKLFQGNTKTELEKAFVPFSNEAEYYCMNIKDIGFKLSGDRDYENSPLTVTKGHGGGIFIIFNEIEMEILRVGSTRDFWPSPSTSRSKSSSGSGGAWIVRFINSNVKGNPVEIYFKKKVQSQNSSLTFEQYINNCSIFFLFLKLSDDVLKSCHYETALTKRLDSELKKLSVKLIKLLNPIVKDKSNSGVDEIENE